MYNDFLSDFIDEESEIVSSKPIKVNDLVIYLFYKVTIKSFKFTEKDIFNGNYNPIAYMMIYDDSYMVRLIDSKYTSFFKKQSNKLIRKLIVNYFNNKNE